MRLLILWAYFLFITYTCRCNLYPLMLHFHILKQVAQGQHSLTGESTSTVTGQSVVVFFFLFFFYLIKIEDAGVATTLKIDFSFKCS